MKIYKVLVKQMMDGQDKIDYPVYLACFDDSETANSLQTQAVRFFKRHCLGGYTVTYGKLKFSDRGALIVEWLYGDELLCMAIFLERKLANFEHKRKIINEKK